MKFQKINHIGIVVKDLPSVKAFFLDFGFKTQGETSLDGKWLDKIVRLHDVHTEVVWLQLPDCDVSIELIKYHVPESQKDIQKHPANTFGIQHIAFVVDNIDAVIIKMKENGMEPFSEVFNYENTYKICYVYGPEGIVLEIAQEIHS